MLAVAVIIAGATIAWCTLRKYEAVATIQLVPDKTPSLTPPPFCGTEISTQAVIGSMNCLARVSKPLQLEKKWGLNEIDSIARIRSMLAVQEIGPDLYAIKVTSRDRDEAHHLANTIANSFRDLWREMEAQEHVRKLRELRDAVSNQEQQVTNRLKALDKLHVKDD